MKINAIIQGSNSPIYINLLESSVGTISNIDAVLIRSDRVIHHWDSSNISFVDNIITLNLKQEDTLNFETGDCSLQIKYLVDGLNTYFLNPLHLPVLEWGSKNILGVDSFGNTEQLLLEGDVITNTFYVNGSGGSVSSVNSQLPDPLNGNVVINSNHIPFDDGETFQEKYDNNDLQGKEGTVYTPSILQNDNIITFSWSNTDEKPNPENVDVVLPSGLPGSEGVTFVPKVTMNNSEIIISWSNNGELENPITTTITIPQDGEDGAVFTPSTLLNETKNELTIMWTNNKGLPNPDPITLKAPQGSKGDPFTYEDFTQEQLLLLKGDNGTTFTPNVNSTSSDVTISWSNDGGKQNPESVNIPIPKDGAPFTYEDFTEEQLEFLKVTGDSGVTFTPQISQTSNQINISWSNDGGLQNPPSVNIPIPSDGDDGAIFIPTTSLNVEGDKLTLSWSNNQGLPNPQSVTLKAPQGLPGTPGLTTSVKINGNVYEVNENGEVEVPTVDIQITLSDGNTANAKLVGYIE